MSIYTVSLLSKFLFFLKLTFKIKFFTCFLGGSWFSVRSVIVVYISIISNSNITIFIPCEFHFILLWFSHKNNRTSCKYFTNHQERCYTSSKPTNIIAVPTLRILYSQIWHLLTIYKTVFREFIKFTVIVRYKL